MIFDVGVPYSLAETTSGAAKLLSCELEQAHDELLQAMAEMAAVTQSDVPVRSAYTRARWRLSVASKRRRAAWEKAKKHLITHCGQATLETLNRLAGSNEELRRASTAHIARWSAESIDADWKGYCEASRAIRWKMMSIVRHERRDILPLLNQLP